MTASSVYWQSDPLSVQSEARLDTWGRRRVGMVTWTGPGLVEPLYHGYGQLALQRSRSHGACCEASSFTDAPRSFHKRGTMGVGKRSDLFPGDLIK